MVSPVEVAAEFGGHRPTTDFAETRALLAATVSCPRLECRLQRVTMSRISGVTTGDSYLALLRQFTYSTLSRR